MVARASWRSFPTVPGAVNVHSSIPSTHEPLRFFRRMKNVLPPRVVQDVERLGRLLVVVVVVVLSACASTNRTAGEDVVTGTTPRAGTIRDARSAFVSCMKRHGIRHARLRRGGRIRDRRKRASRKVGDSPLHLSASTRRQHHYPRRGRRVPWRDACVHALHARPWSRPAEPDVPATAGWIRRLVPQAGHVGAGLRAELDQRTGGVSGAQSPATRIALTAFGGPRCSLSQRSGRPVARGRRRA